MNNSFLIKALQILPTALARRWKGVRNLGRAEAPLFDDPIFGVKEFLQGPGSGKRALLILSPAAWRRAVAESPKIKLFNYTGLTHEIVKALNGKGYLVDIVDYRKAEAEADHYDLVIAHGGNCSRFLDELSPEIPVLQYVAGAYWRAFDSETDERYAAFQNRYGLKEALAVRRTLDGIRDGEQKLTERADFLFSVELPRMVETFEEHQKKFFRTGLGAYLDEMLRVDPDDRDYNSGRKNFIYVGGTGGNIQKGLDVLLEAFALTPELHLYLYCKVEPEILEYCREKLNRPNIHYIYHLTRTSRGRVKLKEIAKKICFTVHAPINTGLGTAYMGSLGLGLIPVGYVDLKNDPMWTVLTESWQPEGLAITIREASVKSPEWCREASETAVRLHRENWSSEAFHGRFLELIDEVGLSENPPTDRGSLHE
ncbi:hypothetical protein N8522_05675 [Akkermansiaceae bacterium]|nr:hypothetical protein [Akkermansiaceae bacterium]MDA7675128.1 hypothetical protein [Akkermansiaceae bacterium]MDB4305806.1 hypothetical protein [Akkermansiaceae bacterium]MDB4411848.1 hypothetical protein [Akkermansiaceae bacterium]MDB4670066.1 hypothetical protein [Akkermansiaceae bacterium]